MNQTNEPQPGKQLTEGVESPANFTRGATA